MIVDLDKVSSAMEEVAATIILPRFQKLSTHEIEEKSKGDFVTIADREAEKALSPILKALAPGSIVVGEEATSENPALLDQAKGEGRIWFIDPIDGTSQFIDGKPTFATMIAYAESGEVRQSAIYFPVSGELFLAERNSGAILRDAKDAHRLRLSKSETKLNEARTSFHTRHYPASWKMRLDHLRANVSEIVNGFPSACQYTDLARGEMDLVVYHRMLPWDHAPGSLILHEAGGLARDLETELDYRPSTLHGPHILAVSEELWQAAKKAMS